MLKIGPRKKAARQRPRLSLEVVGWREYVMLPALKLGPLAAKVDTGARTAALHALNVRVYRQEDQRRVRFEAVVDEARQITRRCELPLHGIKRVKNSSGVAEDRCVVETDLQIGLHRWRALVTLTDRADMGFPMLIGRSSIKGRFLVHPSRSFLISRPKSILRRKRP
jgi:hypothetical protein